jgi:hypothetical protein
MRKGKWHEPLCFLREPCDEEYPEHGFCGNSDGTSCIHCMSVCICDRLKKLRVEERQACAEDVGNMLRAMPYVPANSPHAIEWAERWIRDIHEEADEW